MRNKWAVKRGVYQLSGIGTVKKGYRMDDVNMLDRFTADGKRVCSRSVASGLWLCFCEKSMISCESNERLRKMRKYDRRSGALFLWLFSCQLLFYQ